METHSVRLPTFYWIRIIETVAYVLTQRIRRMGKKSRVQITNDTIEFGTKSNFTWNLIRSGLIQNSQTQWIDALNSYRVCVELFHFAIRSYRLTQLFGKAPTFRKNWFFPRETARWQADEWKQPYNAVWHRIPSFRARFWISYFTSFNFPLFGDFSLLFS